MERIGLPERSIRASLVVDQDHYAELIAKLIQGARISVWIATANAKELRVEAPIGTRARAAGRYISLLDALDDLKTRGVEIRMLHGADPSRPFKAAQKKTRSLKPGLWMRQCPRVHLKMIAVDGRALYLGSANFTGAGLGAKADGRRNFEMGMLTSDELWLDTTQKHFDKIFSGQMCKTCKIRGLCPKPIDQLLGTAKTAKTASTVTSLRKPPTSKA
jgi:phosphatidylserine/phosphatidylglycerophosphate/cardiolipin synthase-like enzyme